MPRSGDNYDYPAGTLGISGQTIYSARYNAWVEDIKATLNLPLPISKGGTGADNATAARDNLDTEVAGQTVVNYDTHIWEAGSFWSQTSATGGPAPGQVVTGICVMIPGSTDWITLHATDHATGAEWIRIKAAGTWGAWKRGGRESFTDGSEGIGAAAADMWFGLRGTGAAGHFVVNSKADLSGVDFFTVAKPGAVNLLVPVKISTSTSHLNLDRTDTSGFARIYGSNANVVNWALDMPGNSVGDFEITRYDNSGVYAGKPFAIKRADGNAAFANNVTVSGILQTNGTFIAAANVAHTFGVGGTGTAPVAVVYQGSSGVGGGVNQQYFKGGTLKWIQGFHSSIYGSSSDDWMIHNPVTGQAVLQIASATNVVTVFDRVATPSPASNALFKIAYHPGAGSGMAFRPNFDGSVAVMFENSGSSAIGSIGVTASGTSFNTLSDERLKEDLKSFDAGNIIENTNVYDFAWKSTGERSYGVIAQQANEVYPTAVTYSKEQDWWGIDYSKYVPVILQELKALRARVAELEGRLGEGTQPALKLDRPNDPFAR